ncbi:titin-like [Ipomoea triloba]|uniref:titin-like n=1 Tax=Ipomoea triloba TaxID=35885 RepID=UPI00125E251C|nr:titin-like [Ipomoea triloba]
MAMIVNYMMDPPGGEPIWLFYSRATQLDFMKGFLKPLAVESGESSQEKPPEEIIEISDSEEDKQSDERPSIEKPLPIIYVEQEPIETTDDSLFDLPTQNVISPASIVSNVPAKEPSLPLPPVESENIVPSVNLPCLPVETQSTGSEESQTVLPTDSVSTLPNAPQAEPHTEPQPSLSVEPSLPSEPQKIQVFPESSLAVRRKTRSASIQIEATSPTQTRKSKRKQSAPEKSPPKSKAQKRKKQTAEKQPSPLIDLTVDLTETAVEVHKPLFPTGDAEARWEIISKRQILGERFLDVEKFIAQCQLLRILEILNLMKEVTKLKDYPPAAIKEFYANLMETIDQPISPLSGRVWIRNEYYNFSPGKINLYLGIDVDDTEDPEIDQNTVAKKNTSDLVSYCPTKTNLLHAKLLTTKYAILHNIALANWITEEHKGELNYQMAWLICKIGKGIPVDMGHIIFNQVISFLEPKGLKVKLPFPSTIYGMLSSQGFKPYPGQAMEKPTVRQIDPKLK